MPRMPNWLDRMLGRGENYRRSSDEELRELRIRHARSVGRADEVIRILIETTTTESKRRNKT